MKMTCVMLLVALSLSVPVSVVAQSEAPELTPPTTKLQAPSTTQSPAQPTLPAMTSTRTNLLAQTATSAMAPAADPGSEMKSAAADSYLVTELSKNGWLVAGEAAGVNILLWMYNRYLRDSGQNPGFRISTESWKENILNGFEWDDNNFATNQFAHPYHGNLYYNAARSNGYDFWGSMPFVFGGSFMWEYFCETHHPSINDWVATSIGGITLGESTFRLSSMILDNTATGSSRFWKELGGFLVNPMRGLNRIISGNASRVHANPAGRFPNKLTASYEIGTRTTGEERVWQSDTTRVYMRMDFLYGNPFEGDHERPFDSFDFSLQLNFSDKSLIGLAQAKGLLFADFVAESENAQHLIGAYQHYDYINNWVMEWGGQSISASYLSEIEMGRAKLATEFHALGVILAGTASDYESFTGRSYDYGPGLGFEFQTVLFRNQRPFFTLGHSSYWLHILNGNSANHYINFTWARLDIQLQQYFGLGVEYDLYYADRNYDDFPDVSARFPEIKFFASWILY
jgi:hypothetical protein